MIILIDLDCTIADFYFTIKDKWEKLYPNLLWPNNEQIILYDIV